MSHKKLVVVCFAVIGLAFVLFGHITTAIKSPKTEARAPEYVPDQPPGSTVLLVGVLPEGTKVYRIDNEKYMIVPCMIAVSPNGQVSFTR